MDENRWGLTTSSNESIFGENTTMKILCTQTFVILSILLVIQPAIISQSTTTYGTPQIHFMKVFIITIMIVATTYLLPDLLRK